MKKMILFAAAAIMMAFGASAQMSLVKDLAKKAATGNPMDMMTVLQQIEPAFTNPESANDVLTWYTAGKAAFSLFDTMYGAKSLGQPVDDNAMSEALSAAYEFYQMALPLDTIVELNKDGSPKLNKDGSKKVKTKYSKEIVGTLISHMGDIANAGNLFLQQATNKQIELDDIMATAGADDPKVKELQEVIAQNWASAAASFGKFADIATSPFAKANDVAAPDSTLSQVRFYEGYSQYQIQDFENAYNAFTQARKLGYLENNIADFQTSSLANMVQGMLDKKDYDKAISFIDNALKGDPMNATLHDIKGFTMELKDDIDAALPFYRKATEVDPTYPNGFFDVGRCLYLKAQKIIEDNPNLNDNELFPKIKPLFDEAIPFLQKAMDLDPTNTKSKSVIDDILYKYELMGVKS